MSRNADAASIDLLPAASGFWLLATIGFGIIGSAIVAALFFCLRNLRTKPLTREVIDTHLAQKLDNYERFLVSTGQCAVIWESPIARPVVVGHMAALDRIGINSKDILRFGQWLDEGELRVLDEALSSLRQDAHAFNLYLKTSKTDLIEATGLIAGTAAIVRFQDLSKQQEEVAKFEKDAIATQTMLELRNTLLDALDEPVWLNDSDGRVIFANRAFCNASGYDPENVRDVSLFNETIRQKLLESKPLFKGSAYAIVQGDRKLFEVTEVSSQQGVATFAHDISALEELSEEIKRMSRGHSETLDQISTAVAIFGSDQKLKFANQAFAMLWPLDTVFLESEPSHTLLLDRLREQGIIAEKPDWRRWKEELFSAYRSGEPSQQIWNLPDGRTLRVLASPHPQGGVTWLFENLTEKIDLERRYNSLIEMQGETLDHLTEGVAVFGADGRVRLSNPALAKLWSLPAELTVEGTHIAKLQAQCAPQTNSNAWDNFSAFITGFSEARDAISGRMDLHSGIVLDYALVPLPNSQTMMTFVNVTDTVNITRALQEKNEALRSADALRSEFVRHVSYELRTPLTNIIGFSDMLQNELFGPLNARQHEYLKHIASESGALLDIVNDILDLAKLDAGIMVLDIKEVDIADAMAYATERTKERLGSRPVAIKEEIEHGLTTLPADAARLRQIFVNVLSNAANFAPDNSVISFIAKKQGHDIVFTVHDEGCGIPEEILDTVFKRFSSYAHHGSRAGAGLGLSIVKSFVELHGGEVTIETGRTDGTTVYCRFPAQRIMSQALPNSEKPE
ncbi:ATP-binding protein [uncultured Bartonella sp.]|uniref:ATP-binding protein n=1 Tax=uncultured Bartonella sp. TaxID=104108 RepID=UPI00262935CF|nr:ATP-binding protein [uncultured Bartonella sp.]